MKHLKFQLTDQVALAWIALFGVGYGIYAGFAFHPAYFTSAIWAAALFISQYLCSLRGSYIKMIRTLLEESLAANWSLLARVENQDRTGEEWKRGGSE